MRKMIFTLMLAIVSSVWMMKAACLMQAPEAMYQPFETVSGTLTSIGFPCEGEEPCPTCLTIALVTDAKTYYLSTSDAQMQAQLDELEMQLPLRATISGTPFVNGSFDFIKVQSVSVDNSLLPSLCDEWNVWYESFESFGPISFDKVVKYQLTTDTIINGQRYVKLTSDKDSPYLGAMREGNNRDIYYVPAGSTNEFLLYAFNAQVGEVLNDLYLGGFEENGYSGRVEAISNGSPRLFTIRVLYPDGMGVEPGESFSVTWIEGVGSPETPYGLAVVPTVPADIGVYSLLCAYKNGKHIYTSDMGEQYGCEHDRDPNSTPADTIPLYTQDDSGSSTVDPVDPNQVIATLKGDELTIRDNSGEEIMMALSLSEGEASVPAFNRVQRTQSFRNELTVTLTEEGLYRLELSNPSWEYTIYGTFRYPQQHDAIDQTLVAPAAQKILRNGQLLIRIGDKVYTVHGAEIKE